MNSTADTLRPSVTQQPNDPGIGDSLGRFVIEERIAEGGFGQVFKAQDPHVKRPVAIKVFHWRQFAHAPEKTKLEAVTRFWEGALHMRKLRSPLVVEIDDGPFCEANGLVWFAMEFVPGGNLAQNQPLLTWIEKKIVASDLLAAIQVGHSTRVDQLIRRLIHRDVRPPNVLIRRTDSSPPRALLTDFDIAYHESELDDSKTTRLRFGNQRYMPPELALAATASVRDLLRRPQNDLHAAGVTILELFFGMDIQLSREPGEIWQQLREVKSPHMNQPRARHIVEFCTHAIREKPQQRFQTIEEMIAAWNDVTRAAPWCTVAAYAAVLTISCNAALVAHAMYAAVAARGEMTTPVLKGLYFALNSVIGAAGLWQILALSLYRQVQRPNRKLTTVAGRYPKTTVVCIVSGVALAGLLGFSACTLVVNASVRLADAEGCTAFFAQAARLIESQSAVVSCADGKLTLGCAMQKSPSVYPLSPLTKCEIETRTPTKKEGFFITTEASSEVFSSSDPATCRQGSIFHGQVMMALNEVSEERVNSFCLDSREVNRESYAECVATGACSERNSRNRWPGMPTWVGQRRDMRCSGPSAKAAANCLSWPDAQNYCRFRKGRLPRLSEWYIAAGRHSQYTNPSGALVHRNGDANLRYAANASVVSYLADGGTHVRDRTPKGVFDLLGGVSEWVDLDVAIVVGGGRKPAGDAHLAVGLNWDAEYAANWWEPQELPDLAYSAVVGFRCAYKPELGLKKVEKFNSDQ